jgi:ribosomal protein S8
MTYKANIRLQTGKTPEDFVELAQKKGFIRHGKTVAKHGEMLAWLKTEMGLGHGHANAIILYLKSPELAKKKIQQETKKSKTNRAT